MKMNFQPCKTAGKLKFYPVCSNSKSHSRAMELLRSSLQFAGVGHELGSSLEPVGNRSCFLWSAGSFL